MCLGSKYITSGLQKVHYGNHGQRPTMSISQEIFNGKLQNQMGPCFIHVFTSIPSFILTDQNKKVIIYRNIL